MKLDFLTEEHHILRKAVRRFVEREIAPHADRWEEEGTFPRELYKKWADAGFLGAGYPEALGGTESDIYTGMIICEELIGGGSPGVAASLGIHAIAVPPIVEFGTEEQKQQFAVPVIRGDRIASLAITEPGTGSDVAGITTRAKRDGDEYVVNGAKMFITSGTRADFFTTAVRTGEEGHAGVSVLLIESDRPGVTVSPPLKKMGWCASDTAEIGFDDVRVPASNLLGDEGGGFLILMKNFAAERLALAVMAVKMGQMAFDAAAAYAKERHAFGRPINKFQVQKHRLAEMATRLDVAWTYTYSVASQLEAGEPCIAEVAMCKNFVVAAAKWVIDEAVQIHGGYGFMKEYLVERLYRDIRLYPIGGGTDEMMREIIARQLNL